MSSRFLIGAIGLEPRRSVFEGEQRGMQGYKSLIYKESPLLAFPSKPLETPI
jgi:hypothetical protein